MPSIFGNPGLKRFKLGSGSAGKMEYVFAGALGLIIVVALFLTVYYGIMGGGSASVGKGDPNTHFQCIKCKHEFTMAPNTIPQAALAKADDPSNVKLDCPACKAKGTCYIEVLCPKCGTWYAPPSKIAFDQGKMGVPDVCPKCGTNRIDYLREQLKKGN
jgi:hypothetical protein